MIRTKRLVLIPKTLADVRAEIAGMSADDLKQLSADWLAQLDSPTVGPWTLGFAIADGSTNETVGGCGYKGPPDVHGIVEIAYGIAPDHQGKGYATEAAAALVEHAFNSDQVSIVRAHTIEESNASARVLTKCGFLPAGTAIDPEDGLVWRWERCRF